MQEPQETVRLIKAPYLPWQVDKQHLKSNGKLLSDETIQKVKQSSFPDSSQILYLEKKNFDGYDVVFLEGRYYILYPTPIGEGGSATAFVMQDMDSSEWAVFKQFKGAPDGEYVARIAENEHGILRRLKRAKGMGATLDDNNTTIFSMIGMTLTPGIPVHQLPLENFSELRLLNLIINILKQADYFHGKNILHRDINPSNMIFDPPNHVRFVDVGGAVYVNNREFFLVTRDFIGTKGYIPPEHNSGTVCVYNRSTEMYSLGATIDWLTQKNPTLRSRIAKHIAEMTSANPFARPSLSTSLQYFEKIKDKHLQLNNDFKNVGILTIDELILGESDVILKFIPALRALDEVWLVGKPSVLESKHLGKIMKHLADKGVALAGVVETEGKIDDVVTYIENKSKGINRYFHVVDGKNWHDRPDNAKYGLLSVRANYSEEYYREQVKECDVYLSSKQFEFAERSLKEEIKRLETRKAYWHSVGKKILTKRIASINTELAELKRIYTDNKLTYKMLQKRIASLQDRMTHTNPIKRSLSKVFKTDSHNKLAEIPRHILWQSMRAR